MQIISVSIVAALVTSIAAQSLSGVPSCAASCVGDSLTSGTGCSSIDVSCICKSSGWIAGLSCCVSKACSKDDQDKTIKFAQQLCSPYTTLPSVASCSNSTTSANSTSASTSATGSSTRVSSTASGTSATAAAATSAKSSSAAGLKEQVGMGLGMAAAGLFAAVL